MTSSPRTVIRSLRVALVAGLLGILLTAQLTNHNDWFPLGTLGQYAVARAPDAPVLSMRVEARTDADVDIVPVLDAAHSGITRVELESQWAAINADPARLGVIATNWDAHHPGRTLVEVRLVQDVYPLRNGRWTGTKSTRPVATWRSNGVMTP